MIREAVKSDIEALARIHSDSLPHSLLPRLGEEFLKNKFYPMVVTSENTLLLVKELGGKVVGLALFVYDSRCLEKEIMKHKASLGIAVIKRIFSDHRIFSAAFRRLCSPKIRTDKTEEFIESSKNQMPAISEMPEFYTLAVLPDFRNKGIGTELTLKGLSILQKNDESACIAKPASHIACSFFQKLGFRNIGREIRGPNERPLMIFKKEKV
ncbi:MAG: GNAT family N-acetyltransferase [Deltaproteobacteria bacterium]|nr:GNAT family N-acetyltransferase [Deltaproteobacteria bacterium]MBW2651231.1 GNAT family N-acetyltransferase [Deltaproteobacteria bacterium]